jgi:hypothetical protein
MVMRRRGDIMNKIKLRHLFGNLDCRNGSENDDNLGIALATYFSKRLDRPEDDPEDDETGWSEWVLQNTYALLDRIGECAIENLLHCPTTGPPETVGKIVQGSEIR